MMSPSPDLPPGYSSMPHLPPRYSAGGGVRPPPNTPGPGLSPYTYPSSPHSTASTTPRRRRSLGVDERIPLGAFAKSHAGPATPKISRAHTSPTERINRKPSGGNEWIKGDSFLDACICTTNCTCREGHRVLYRSRDDGRGSGDESDPRYGQGEIRYILKKDLGRDCGDHSACRKGEGSGESEADKKGSGRKKEKEREKKKKKKEDKRRKDEMEGLKEDLLEALDERFEKMRKRGSRRSKAGSVGMESPRPPFAGLGNQGMGATGLNTRMVDTRGGMPMGMGMGMGMPMTLGGGNPYAINIPGQGMNRQPQGMPDPMSGMPFDDDMSIADMDAMGIGNPYLAPDLRTKGLQNIFLSPGRRDPSGIDREAMAYYRKAMSGPERTARYPSRQLHRHQLPPRGGGPAESEESSPGPRRPNLSKRAGGKDRQDSFDKIAAERLREDGDDGPQHTRRVDSPRGNGVRNTRERGQGRHHTRVETDDDDAY
ncbi:hypothetical protein DE146DRAFT_646728 [Phaeosphaeria sp. MPI-PUGE-AT-0046c]|nr:hypothetical protein DE146DRAFT_646728 [Phaeosphaeria sp. MPI-PUGE-AT-0046c]